MDQDQRQDHCSLSAAANAALSSAILGSLLGLFKEEARTGWAVEDDAIGMIASLDHSPKNLHQGNAGGGLFPDIGQHRLLRQAGPDGLSSLDCLDHQLPTCQKV